MSRAVFEAAQKAYTSGDYKAALSKFVECAQDLRGFSQEDLCKFYHMLGNCYIKNGKVSAASAAYSMALDNASPERKPALYVNLGTALLSGNKNTEALVAFNNALQFESYAAPYKAYSGIGAAQLQLGNVAEAGAAYREAAVDRNNPTPAKALVNLGVCFMEMGRPQDAIVSYETALDLGLDPAMQNKANANLGQAYMSEGRFFDALDAFENATADGTYKLNELAAHDFAIAQSLEGRFGADLEELYNAKSEELFDEDGDVLPPYQTGEIDLGDAMLDEDEVSDYDAGETMMFPRDDEDGEYGDEEMFENSSFFADDSQDEDNGDEMFAPSENHYSNFSNDAFESEPYSFDTNSFDPQQNYDQPRKKKRKTGKVILIIVIIVVVLALAGCVAGYFLGYGYPLQEQTVSSVFTAAQNGEDASEYWSVSVSDNTRENEMAMISGLSNAQVVAVERSRDASSVYVKGTLKEGGESYYKIDMVRNKVGWKVSGIDLVFLSQL